MNLKCSSLTLYFKIFSWKGLHFRLWADISKVILYTFPLLPLKVSWLLCSSCLSFQILRDFPHRTNMVVQLGDLWRCYQQTRKPKPWLLRKQKVQRRLPFFFFVLDILVGPSFPDCPVSPNREQAEEGRASRSQGREKNIHLKDNTIWFLILWWLNERLLVLSKW